MMGGYAGRMGRWPIGVATVVALFVAGEPAWGQLAERGATVSVTSEAELRKALARVADGDVNVLIDRPVVVRRPVYAAGPTRVVRLMGTTREAGIRFDMVFSGRWEREPQERGNGIEIAARQVVIRGLAFSGYDQRGSALKFDVGELLDISRCRFEDIAAKQFPPRRPDPKSADDVLCNNVIGSHEQRTAHISVSNCEFRRCTLSNQRWSHCLYVSARSVSVTDNRFIQCGNPLQIGSNVAAGAISVFGNTIEQPIATPGAQKSKEPAFLAALYPTSNSVYAFNTIAGTWKTPWTGHPRRGLHLVDYNDYDGATIEGPWGADTGIGKWISWAQWREMGFDGHSKPSPAQR